MSPLHRVHTVRWVVIALVFILFVSLVVPAAAQTPCGSTVTVASGDTLSRIAVRCGVTLQDLVLANPQITDPSRIFAGQILTIPSGTFRPPVVAAFPASGGPGTPVQVFANNFPPNANVVVGIGFSVSDYDVVQQGQTTPEGALSAQIVVPPSMNIGAPWVVVVATANSSVSDATGGGAPAVAIYPASGAAGTLVGVIANDFPTGAQVSLGVGPVDSEFTMQGVQIVGPSGALYTQAQIPVSASPDANWVVGVSTQDGASNAMSGQFDVQAPTAPQPFPIAPFPTVPPPPTPVPTQVMFTTATITLIAPGDNGATGLPVGCGDSAVPVTVNFAPTVAPLTATLESLLTLNQQYYGESGLMNALYASDLNLAAVNIVNGEAIISLTGNLSIGGACDAPRVQAQLEQTALQFGTVNRVSIFLNGQPLSVYLSGA